MFVSNIDNTGATLDLKIAQFASDEAADYIMECTAKTESDIKVRKGTGGFLEVLPGVHSLK